MSRISILTMEGTYALSERVEPRGDDRLVIDREQKRGLCKKVYWHFRGQRMSGLGHRHDNKENSVTLDSVMVNR